MPLNLLRKYNERLDIGSLDSKTRTISLKRIFDRDIGIGSGLNYRKIPVVPPVDGEIGLESLFHHLTTRKTDERTNHREFCIIRSERLHWIRYHIEENKKDLMFDFVDDSNEKVKKIYIVDEIESYNIILQEFNNGAGYFLLTAFTLSKKNVKRLKNKASRNSSKKRHVPRHDVI